MEIALKELEPFINGMHLQNGKPFEKIGDMRSREILANWLLCASINACEKNYDVRFSSDPTGGDGVIEDKTTKQTWLTEHIFIPRHSWIGNVETEQLILNAIKKKHCLQTFTYSRAYVLRDVAQNKKEELMV